MPSGTQHVCEVAIMHDPMYDVEVEDLLSIELVLFNASLQNPCLLGL